MYPNVLINSRNFVSLRGKSMPLSRLYVVGGFDGDFLAMEASTGCRQMIYINILQHLCVHSCIATECYSDSLHPFFLRFETMNVYFDSWPLKRLWMALVLHPTCKVFDPSCNEWSPGPPMSQRRGMASWDVE